MGLNLSRGKPTKYYSSNRIASLMGNGLLTFIDKKTQINDFFNKNELIFYEDLNDLADKIKFYKKNDKLRQKISANGRKKYFTYLTRLKLAKILLIHVLEIKTVFFNEKKNYCKNFRRSWKSIIYVC